MEHLKNIFTYPLKKLLSQSDSKGRKKGENKSHLDPANEANCRCDKEKNQIQFSNKVHRKRYWKH